MKSKGINVHSICCSVKFAVFVCAACSVQCELCTVFSLQCAVRHAKRQFFFTQTWFKSKILFPKKCVNYDKSNLRQNSLKGQKEPNSVKKNAKK